MNGRTYFRLSDGSRAFRESEKVWQHPGAEPLDLIKELPVPNASIIGLLHKGIWDPLLPLENPENRLSLGEGETPLLQIEWNGRPIWVKNEFQNPTGSFKDRGAAVMISRALEEQVTHVVEDSSGNAGCAVAAYAAAAGIPCEIYVPEKASPAKLKMMEALGARVVRVKGNRQDTTLAAFEAASKCWFASHVWNPWFMEGTKIFAFEVWRQTGGMLPDEIIFPCANGTLLLGAFIGFSELYALRLISQVPALSAAFAENCAPLLHPEGPFHPTCAEGLAVTHPARRKAILEIVIKTGGRLYSISEKDISTTQIQVARTGLYLEYAAAVALAAAAHAKSDSRLLIPLTGSGLKIS